MILKIDTDTLGYAPITAKNVGKSLTISQLKLCCYSK